MTLPHFLISLLRSAAALPSLPRSPCSPPAQHRQPHAPATRQHPAPGSLPAPAECCRDVVKPPSRTRVHPSCKLLSHGQPAPGALLLTSCPGTHPPGVQPRTPRPPPRTAAMQVSGQNHRHIWLCLCPGPEPCARPSELSAAGHALQPQHVTPCLVPRDAPGSAAQSSTGAGAALPAPTCLLRLDELAVHRVGRLDQRPAGLDHLGERGSVRSGADPGPNAPPAERMGAKGLEWGLPLALAPWLGSGPPRPGTHGQVRCEQRLDGSQDPSNTKEGSGSGCGYSWDFFQHRAQAARAGGCGVPGLLWG